MSLNVNINVNSSGFQQVLNEARQHAQKFANEVSKETAGSFLPGIGHGIIGGFAALFSFEGMKELISGMFETAKSIHQVSEEFDMSTDSVQQWRKALGEANISENTFFRGLETLRGKRQEAREDMTKREGFEALGLTDEALDLSVSDEDLLKQILRSGGSRSDIGELLGRKGATLKAALPHLGSTPLYSEEDVENIHKIEQKSESFWKGIKAAMVQPFIDLMSDKPSLEGWSPYEGLYHEARIQAKKQKELDDFVAADMKAQAEKEEAEKDKASVAAARERREKRKLVLEGDSFERAELAAEFGLRSAERGNMTIGKRREGIRADLIAQTARILRERREVEDGRAGLSEGDWALLTPDEQRKKRQEKQLELIADEAKKQGLLGDLRERPFEHHADSLAKVGLYTASSLNFNPQMIQQQQLGEMRRTNQLLQQIVNKDDPHTM